MEQGPCRICNQPSSHQLGNYLFCQTHYFHATRQRAGLWQADLASIGALLVFVWLVTRLESVVPSDLSSNSLVIIGTTLSIVPAFIWLAFFYRRDRLEPEPKTLVAQQFILGALLASAVGIPIVNDWFQVPAWLSHSPMWAQLLGGFFIVGFTQEFLKYAAVRFSIYHFEEFDELTDGIVYMTAAGLGYATILNIHFVISSGGIDLGNGVIRIALTALAHASFAGITGYFLGREKFEDRPLWWMPAGIAIAAVLNSLFFYLRGLVTQGDLTIVGGDINAWGGMILAIILAGGVTFFLSQAIQYDLRLMLAGGKH